MSISIRCECGQGFRVKDRLAGKALKCPKCSTLLRVPEPEVFEDVLEVVEEVEETLGDPLDDLLGEALADPLGAAPVLPGPTAKRSTPSRQQWMLIAGVVGAIPCLLVVVMALRSLGFASWTSDSNLLGELSEEVAAGPYVIRPPKELGIKSIGSVSGTGGRGRSYTWVSPWGDLKVRWAAHPRNETRTWPTVRERVPANLGAMDHHTYILPTADTSYGRVGELKFTRIAFDHREVKRGGLAIGSAGKHVYNLLYVAYDGANRVEVIASCDEDFDSQQLRILEAAVRSFRKLREGESIAAVQPPKATARRPRNTVAKPKRRSPKRPDQNQRSTARSSSSRTPGANRASRSTNSNTRASRGQAGGPQEDEPLLVGWTFLSDHSPDDRQIPTHKKISIPIPSSSDVLYPTSPSPFVLITTKKSGQEFRSVLDLRTGKPTYEFSGRIDLRRPQRLSPDGKYLAGVLSGSSPKIEIWSLSDAKVAQTLDLPRRSRVSTLHFTGPKQLLTSKIEDGRVVVESWDVTSGRVTSKFSVAGKSSMRSKGYAFNANSLAVSPGGRYAAIVFGHTLNAHDLTSGKCVGQSLLPEPTNSYADQCIGLAFSPDGSDLVGLFSTSSSVRLMGWNMASGQLDLDHVMQNNPTRQPRGASSYRGPSLEWGADKNTLLIYGHTLVDRRTGQHVWSFPATTSAPRKLLTPSRMLLTMRNARARGEVLTTVDIPEKDIAKAVAAVREGGKLVDAVLPPLTTPDRFSLSTKFWPHEAVAWNVDLDAVAIPKQAPRRAVQVTHARTGSNQRTCFSGPEAGKGVVLHRLQVSGRSGRNSSRNMRVVRIDLASGNRGRPFDLPPNYQLLDVSLDGSRALVASADSKGHFDRLDVLSFAPRIHIAGWRPYEDAPAVRAAFVDNDHVLVTDAENNAIFFELPDCRAVYAFEDIGQWLVLSPARKYVFGARDNSFALFEASTGECLGQLETPESLAGGVASAAFRADGRRLAAILVDGENQTVVVWDLTTGQIEVEFPVVSMPAKVTGSVKWCGERHLLIGNTYLLDTKNRAVVWRYHLISGFHAAPNLDGHHWICASDATIGRARSQLFLVPLSLPSQQILDQTAVPQLEDQAMIYPGSRVNLTVRLASRGKSDLQRTVTDNLAAQLRANGVVIDSGAKVTLSVSTEERATGERLQLRRHRFGPGEGNFSEVRLTCVLACVDERGRRWEKTAGNSGTNVLVPEGQDPNALMRKEREAWVARYASGIQLPRYIFPTLDELEIGESQLTLRGEAPLPTPSDKPTAQRR